MMSSDEKKTTNLKKYFYDSLWIQIIISKWKIAVKM